MRRHTVLVVVGAVLLAVSISTAGYGMVSLGDVTLYWGGLSEGSYSHDWSAYVWPAADKSKERWLSNGESYTIDLPKGHSVYYVALVSGCVWTEWALSTEAVMPVNDEYVEVEGEHWTWTGSAGKHKCLNHDDAGLFWGQLPRAGIIPMNQVGARFRSLEKTRGSVLDRVTVRLVSDAYGKTAFRLLVLAK